MNIVGTWDLEITSKLRSKTSNATLTIEDEDGDYNGVFNNKSGRQPVKNLIVSGGDVQFEVGRKLRTKEIPFSYMLTVEEDQLSGTAKMGRFEAAQVVGRRRREREAIASTAIVVRNTLSETEFEIGRALIFVISPPRSGSTLTTRMLGSHPDIFSTPELHLIPPLYHLGFYNPAWAEGESQGEANEFEDFSENYRSYNKKFASYGIKSIVDWMPNFEDDYLEALRAYTNTIYSKLLSKSGRGVLLDKTPQYCRYADFLAKLYPSARYIALTRHPVQTGLSIRKGMTDMQNRAQNKTRQREVERAPVVIQSQAEIDKSALGNFRHYLEGMLKVIKDKSIESYRLKYEDLVLRPEEECQKICDYLQLEYTPAMLEYNPKGYSMPGIVGDPYTVSKYNKPNPELLKKLDIKSQDDMKFAHAVLQLVSPEEFHALGYDHYRMRRELEDLGSLG